MNMAEPRSGTGGGSTQIIRLVAQVIRGRWFMMFATFLIMSSSGSTYVFGIYSKELKKSLSYDQTTLNLLAFFKDLGSSVGILSGLLAELTPPWVSLLLGAAMNFAGYFMLWLSATGHISKPRIWQMCLYISIGANSQNFISTSLLTTFLKNFPVSRGLLIGLLKGCAGLSGAVMTQLYLAIYGNDAKSLILLISWLPAVILICFLCVVREIKVVRQPNEERVFYKYLFISVALAIFLMVITLVQKQKPFSHAGYIGTSIATCFLLFLPLAVSIKEELVLWKMKKRALENPRTVTIDSSTPPTIDPICPPLPPTQVVEDKKSKISSFFSDILNPPKRGEDYTILQAIMSVDMLMIIIGTFSGIGTSLTAIDNLGQIGESLGYPTLTISTFLSLVSIWNFFGRVGTGFMAEWLLSKYGFPRPLIMSIALFFSCIGHIFIAFPFPGALYIASVIVGFCSGAQVTLIYTIISELFGLKYYSTLLNFGILVIPLGSFVFNVRIAGKFYDREALKQLSFKGLSRGSGNELSCVGKHCFRVSFLIMAASTFVGVLSSSLLAIRTRKFYKGDIYKKFRLEEAMAKEAKTENIALSTYSEIENKPVGCK